MYTGKYKISLTLSVCVLSAAWAGGAVSVAVPVVWVCWFWKPVSQHSGASPQAHAATLHCTTAGDSPSQHRLRYTHHTTPHYTILQPHMSYSFLSFLFNSLSTKTYIPHSCKYIPFHISFTIITEFIVITMNDILLRWIDEQEVWFLRG